jgi:hypothetical protein
MNRFKDLWRLYDQWRRLTELEGEGIRLADWGQVAACQKMKEALQTQIIEAARAWPTQAWKSTGSETETEQTLGSLIDQLLALEQRNSEWLRTKREAAQVQKAELEKASRNLHQVQKAYVSGPPPLWHSYS